MSGGAGASTFALAAWRPPLRPRIWVYGLMLPPGAGPTVWIAYPLIRLGVPAWPAIVTGALAYLAVLAWAAYEEFRPRPAGALSFENGRVRFDAWGRRAIDVPLSDVRSAMVLPRRPASFVCISLRGRRRIFVHEPRLGGVRLEDVVEALYRAIDAAPRARLQEASAAATARTRRWVRLGAYAGIAAAGLAILRLLAERLSR